MLITEVTPDYIKGWLELAAEVEHVFQGERVESKEFHNYDEAVS